jgi:hypothetical protein
MRPHQLLVPALSLSAALLGCGADLDNTPIITAIPVAPCGAEPGLDELQVTVQGTVVDLESNEPRAGVTVDVARVWEPEAVFPADSCSVARLTTDAAGRFGPATVSLGPSPSFFETKYVLFLAQGAGISPTATDNRVAIIGGGDPIDHTITAPSLELADVWRAELSEGGMSNARTRGLVAFRFEDANAAPAAGVVGLYATFFEDRPLERGDEVRYLAPDGVTVERVAQSATTTSGMALIGVAPAQNGTREIGGLRGAEDWGETGCLVGDGWMFFEQSRPVVR